MPTSHSPTAPAPLDPNSPQERPSNHEVENENQRPAQAGKAPRPATEPPGAQSPVSPKTRTDPGSGEA